MAENNKTQHQFQQFDPLTNPRRVSRGHMPDQEGQDIRPSDIIRADNGVFFAKEEEQNFWAQSKAVCPTCGTCCNECAGDNNGCCMVFIELNFPFGHGACRIVDLETARFSNKKHEVAMADHFETWIRTPSRFCDRIDFCNRIEEKHRDEKGDACDIAQRQDWEIVNHELFNCPHNGWVVRRQQVCVEEAVMAWPTRSQHVVQKKTHEMMSDRIPWDVATFQSLLAEVAAVQS